MMCARSELLVVLVLSVCSIPGSLASAAPEVLRIESPNSQLQATIRLNEQGQPTFDVTYRGVHLANVALGLEFSGSGLLSGNLKTIGNGQASSDETYAIAVGKASSARDRHNELFVSLEETRPPRRRLDIVVRAFDDGIAFRYLLPEQESLQEFVLTDERTRIAFLDSPQARALPLTSYSTPYESYYESKAVNEFLPGNLFGLPMLLQHPKEIWFAVTEANLTDYAGMYLSGVQNEPGTFISKLSPLPGRKDGAKVSGKTPFKSPLRVLMVADHPGRLIESNIIFHLSDPPKNNDTSWIKPGKTTFPWWNHYVLEGVDFKPGVNTATMKHYIDFCAEQGIPYHSLDGLDIAWYGGPINPEGPTDITKAAPSIDLSEVLRYAKSKGVRLRLWLHWKALKPQIDEAFRVYEEWGI